MPINLFRKLAGLRPRPFCRLCEIPFGVKGTSGSLKYPEICTKCSASERWRVRSNNKRKSNRRHPTGRIRTGDWITCLMEHDYKCAICGKKNRKQLTMDHKLSLMNGGTNTGDNIQPLCIRCHEIKDGHGRHPLWIIRRLYRNIATLLWKKFKISLPKLPRKISILHKK
jgi:hypothetical protein